MTAYDPPSIEAKWQKRWEDQRLFSADISEKPKLYVLDMFPYPSAAGLHVGHPEGYTATDVIARMKRLQGFNVLHPMGWDAFGLPAENYAIQTGVHPREVTRRNIENFRRQIKALGFSYDWSREVDTTDPSYVRWTQWIFLQLFHKGLAYEGVSPINFCPSCKTGLANEEVHQGACERCGTAVERRDMRQWLLKITAYADRLLADLDGLDWPASTLAMQRHWIGRSEGAEVVFQGSGAAAGTSVTVFTTRPDTLFGATYLVLAPEHPLVKTFTAPEQALRVMDYQEKARRKSDLERTDLAREKTGVWTGGAVINPVNGALLPVWIADYVLASYGTGAIMAVPAHDQRDMDFARALGLPIQTVVEPLEGAWTQPDKAFEADGRAVASGPYSGLASAEMRGRITSDLASRGVGRRAVNYRLRDWVFSRQRYWGEPIPLVHCKARCGGVVPVPESQLPVLLPEVERFQPSATGQSPLADVTSWVRTSCPICGGPAERETNTMPQWAGSCWYYLRFLDPRNDREPWSAQAERYWMGNSGVDLYVGGAEHAVLHLLYARFWHKFFYDLKLVSSSEPFHKLRHQGMVLAFSYQDELGAYHGPEEVDLSGSSPRLKSDGRPLTSQVEKMSKSKKNVVSPDDVVAHSGADAMRLYELFMGDFEESKPWDSRNMAGVVKFLHRVWRAAQSVSDAPGDPQERLRHRTVQRVTERIDQFKFNTALSALMEFVNALETPRRTDIEVLAILLSPFAPHLAEEVWEFLGNKTTLAQARWPEIDPTLLREDTLELPVQINGKVRDRVTVPREATAQEVLRMVKELPRLAPYLSGQRVVKEIVVPERLVSLVVHP